MRKWIPSATDWQLALAIMSSRFLRSRRTGRATLSLNWPDTKDLFGRFHGLIQKRIKASIWPRVPTTSLFWCSFAFNCFNSFRKVYVWKEIDAKYQRVYEYNQHDASVNSISWAPEEYGLLFACCSTDCSISVVQAFEDIWKPVKIYKAHEQVLLLQYFKICFREWMLYPGRQRSLVGPFSTRQTTYFQNDLLRVETIRRSRFGGSSWCVCGVYCCF